MWLTDWSTIAQTQEFVERQRLAQRKVHENAMRNFAIVTVNETERLLQEKIMTKDSNLTDQCLKRH